MPSPTDPVKSGTYTAETLAICLILACSLQIMENLIPRIPVFPWLRIGLSYWILLPFLLRFGVKPALILFLLRNVITLIYGGQVFSAFIISSLAGVVSFSTAGWAGLVLYRQSVLGLMGVSIALATVFNVSQLFIVDRMFIQHSGFYFQAPPLLLWSLISGIFIAFLVYKSQPALERVFNPGFKISPVSRGPAAGRLSGFSVAMPLLAFVLFVSLFLLQTSFQHLFPLVFLVLISGPRRLRILLLAWPFYLYISWLHLFQTDGFYIFRDWITEEGLEAFIFYALRMTNVILCGQWLARYIPRLWRTPFGSKTLRAVSLSLPLFPTLFGISIAMGREIISKIRKGEFANLLDPILERLMMEFKQVMASAGSTKPE